MECWEDGRRKAEAGLGCWLGRIALDGGVPFYLFSWRCWKCPPEQRIVMLYRRVLVYVWIPKAGSCLGQCTWMVILDGVLNYKLQ